MRLIPFCFLLSMTHIAMISDGQCGQNQVKGAKLEPFEAEENRPPRIKSAPNSRKSSSNNLRPKMIKSPSLPEGKKSHEIINIHSTLGLELEHLFQEATHPHPDWKQMKLSLLDIESRLQKLQETKEKGFQTNFDTESLQKKIDLIRGTAFQSRKAKAKSQVIDLDAFRQSLKEHESSDGTLNSQKP